MIRIATKEDAKALLDIYKYYVEQTTITFEYETPSVEEFERRIENTLKKYPYLVEEEDGIISFGGCSCFPIYFSIQTISYHLPNLYPLL